MKYLVTGGAGFLGINLIRYLLAKGDEVISLDKEDFLYPEDAKKIRVVKGDIRDMPTVINCTRGVDIVVHCAAALPLYSKEEIFTTDVGGTRNVLQAALELNVKRAIHISSTAVYGIPDHHPLLEDDQKYGVGPYGEAKVQAEEVCAEYRAKGLCVPILRPKSFIGPERLGIFAMFYEWALEGLHFPILGSGKNLYQFLDVEDLCEAIYLCAAKEAEKVNDVFNIGAAEFSTMKDDFQVVLDKAGYGKKIKCFPAAPMVWALRFLELMKLSPIYKWIYETAYEESFVSIEKAQKILGYRPRYSNKDALLRNFQWYQDNLEKFRGKTGVSHTVPWKQGILSLAKVFFK